MNQDLQFRRSVQRDFFGEFWVKPFEDDDLRKRLTAHFRRNDGLYAFVLSNDADFRRLGMQFLAANADRFPGKWLSWKYRSSFDLVNIYLGKSDDNLEYEMLANFLKDQDCLIIDHGRNEMRNRDYYNTINYTVSYRSMHKLPTLFVTFMEPVYGINFNLSTLKNFGSPIELKFGSPNDNRDSGVEPVSSRKATEVRGAPGSIGNPL